MKETSKEEIKRGDKIEIIKIQLQDGSVFTIKNRDFVSALRMKLEVDNLTLNEFIFIFREKVKKHWEERTVPTKFPWDEKWEKVKKFKNQAPLAKEVLYQYIRPYLFGILLSRASEGKLGSIVTSDNSISLVKEGTLINKKIKKEDQNEKKRV